MRLSRRTNAVRLRLTGQYSMLERGYAAGCAVLAMPIEAGVLQSAGLHPTFGLNSGHGPQIIERNPEGPSPTADQAAQPQNQIERFPVRQSPTALRRGRAAGKDLLSAS